MLCNIFPPNLIGVIMGKKLFKTEEGRGLFLKIVGWATLAALLVALAIVMLTIAFEGGTWKPFVANTYAEDGSWQLLVQMATSVIWIIGLALIGFSVVLLGWRQLVAANNSVRQRFSKYESATEKIGEAILTIGFWIVWIVTWPIHTPFRVLAHWKRTGSFKMEGLFAP